MGAKCSSRNVDYGQTCDHALDGSQSTDFFSNSCYHSAENTKNPYMQIDLGKTAQVDMINVLNRYLCNVFGTYATC